LPAALPKSTGLYIGQSANPRGWACSNSPDSKNGRFLDKLVRVFGVFDGNYRKFTRRLASRNYRSGGAYAGLVRIKTKLTSPYKRLGFESVGS